MPLDRRTLLRGAGGIALALPWLDAMAAPRTRASPRRIVFVFTPNGDQITHRFLDKGERTFRFGEFLAPYEPYRDRMIAIEGVDKRFQNLQVRERGDNHQQGGSGLAPWPAGPGEYVVPGGSHRIGYVRGPSADYVLGGRVLAADPSVRERHLVFRVGGAKNDISNLHAHAGPPGVEHPIPPEVDPLRAYARLFGTGDGKRVEESLAMRRSLLDLVREETEALAKKLGPEDRRRLEQHTESLRAVERSLAALPAACVREPLRPVGAGFDPLDETRHVEVGHLFFQIIALAFACDLTRVVQFNWSGNKSDRVYRNLGSTAGHHTISHETSDAAFAQIRAIHRHLATSTLALYRNLLALPEGDATLFDETLIVHWNELGQGNNHDTRNNLVLLGGGRHFARGRYVDVSRRTNNAWSDLLVSCFHAMGFDDVDRFGDVRLGSGGPLDGLG